jgi:hypothetical protein
VIHSLEDLFGITVSATDGEIGKITNFLFDDQSWQVRYLVVDVGGWLGRRDVLLSVDAIEPPDWKSKSVRVRLTKNQIRNSPDVDSKKPVSRQQEIAMSKYYGWAEYWNEHGNVSFPPVSAPVGREFPVQGDADPHLRSSDGIIGYSVWAKNVEMGRLEALIIDEGSWHIGYLDAKMGDWLRGRSVLVSTREVADVSWVNHRVNLRPGNSGAR